MIASVPARQTTPNDRRGSFTGPIAYAPSAGQVAAAGSAAAAAPGATTAAGTANITSPVAPRAGRWHQLRPLDADQSAVLAHSTSGSGSGLLMGITGTRTGEEKFVSAVEVRQAPGKHGGDGSAADANKQRTRSQPTAVTDADRIRRLEAELRKSQEALRKKTSDMDAARATHKDALAAAAAAADQARADALDAQAKQHEAASRALRAAADDTAAQLRKCEDELRKKAADDDEAIRRREGEFNASAMMWASERGIMQKEAQAARDKLDAEVKRAAALAGELRTLRDEKELSRRDASTVEQQLRTELAAALQQIRELKAVIESQRENVAAWERRVLCCNDFIMRICQPKFSVVKDDKQLTPMTQAEAAQAAGQATAGFVLVPLALMLDAYELLPQDSKKLIAHRYEQDKKAKP